MSMIKCPECGQNVSSMAGTCPHCGVAIAGNLKECPNCHSFCLNSQQECPECHATLSVVTDEKITPTEPACENKAEQPQPTVQENNEKQEQSTDEKEKKPNHTPLIVTFVICAILIIVGAYFWNYQRRVNREEQAYTELQNVTNPEYYQQFLIDFPDSKYYGDVQERMKQLQQENQMWNQVISNKTRVDVVEFMRQYPNSIRKAVCENMLDSLDWSEAKSLNTEEAAAAYLTQHPNGMYVNEASEMKDNKARTKVSDAERGMVHGILDTFVNALAKQDAAQITSTIPQTMSTFNNTANATPEQIANYVGAKVEKDVIGIHYLINEPMAITKEILPDGNIGYSVSFSMNETISRSDTNQPNSKSYQVAAKLNAEHKITSFIMR